MEFMHTNYQADELSFTPWKGEFSGYSITHLRKDLLAGLEVALITIPQAIAYSLVAGLPISCGLYAAIFSAIVATIAGSSRFLIVGPINAIAILMQAGTADILYTYYRDVPIFEKENISLQIMTQMALLAGTFQVLAALFKLGRFSQFVSHSVIIGYLAGSALAIITNQLFVFSGVPALDGVHSLFEKISYFIFHLEKIDIPTISIGIGSLILFIFLKKIGRRLPTAALMLIASTSICYLLGLTSLNYLIARIPFVGSTMDAFSLVPLFSWPSFNPGIMNHMLSSAFAIALLSIIETTCSAKTIAAASGIGISINQEILSVGLANLTSSCTGSIPVSVSNSRSQYNWQSDAKTRLSAFFSALFVATIIGYFGPMVNSIPLPALAALLFFSGLSLINLNQLIICLNSTSSDAMVMIITFIGCVFLNLDTAFYIGVILSVSLYLKKAAMPALVEFAIGESGELRGLDPPQAYHKKPIRVIKVEGELFFGSADIFYTTLRTLAEDDESTRVILLQLKNARDIDATACLSLLQLFEYLEKGKRHLVLCGMTHEMWDVMSNSGLIARIKKENLFVFDEHNPHFYMQKALTRAKFLSQDSQEDLAINKEQGVSELNPFLSSADLDSSP